MTATRPVAGAPTPWGPTLWAYLDTGYGAQAVSYGATGNGVTDDTSALNAALASGYKRVLVGDGTYKISSPITVPAGVELVLSPGATINNTVYNTSAVILNGAGSKLSGGTITSPSTWDGTSTAWTYGVVWILGDGCQVSGVTLTNVPKIGIGALDVNDVRIIGNRIVGNYPTGQWTGTETEHFGIAYNPPSGSPHGNVVISGNVVRSCVQGFCIAGPGTVNSSGVAISGNAFESCWNHGVYVYGYGISVAGNAFNRCGIPVAMWGQYHSVTGNTLYTDTTGGSDARDLTGISMRDSFGCTVVGNTIRGNGGTGAVIINLTQNSGTDVSNNVVADNTIDVVGVGIAIRVGSGATTCKNNVVRGNVIRGSGTSGQGLITLISSGNSLGNTIEGNTVVMLGETHGIYVSKITTARVAGNYVRLEYDAPSATTLACVAIAADAGAVNVTGNQFEVTASFGANVTFRGVYEFSAGPGGNRIVSNSYSLDPTKATPQPLSLQATNASYIDEALTGSPAGVTKALPGSRWMNLSGGAATTLFVKESGTTNAGWVGK